MLLGRVILKPTDVFTATPAHHMSQRVSEEGWAQSWNSFSLKDEYGEGVEESESYSQLSDSKAEYIYLKGDQDQSFVFL